MNDTGRVEVWQDDDGQWRWRYRDDKGVDLLGNEGHPTTDEAVHAASVSYPGVRIEILPTGQTTHPARRGLARTVRSFGFVLLSVVVAVPVAIAMLVRRLARLLRR